MPTHLEDPLQRLRYATEQMSIAKRNWQNMPGHLLREASSLLPADRTLGPAVQVLTRLPDRLTPRMMNINISNVKGPAQQPSYDATPMERYIVFGCLSPGVGVIFGGQSLGDHIAVCATCCIDILPDYRELQGYLYEALDELVALTSRPASLPPSGQTMS